MSVSARELAATVPPGSTVAIGGVGLSRKPMALVRGLVDAGVTGLRVVSFLGSVDVELLLAAGAAAEVHTAGTSLEAAGLAPCYRRARQEGSGVVVEWSEGSLHAAIEATARGLPSEPCSTSPASAVVAANPALVVAPDPFTGVDVVVARALAIDVALLHVPEVDAEGNLFVAGDGGIDGLLARAADRVLATASRLGERSPREAAISRIWVDATAVDPRGAWPTACHPTEVLDLPSVQAWARSGGSDPAVLTPAAVTS